MNVYEVLGKYSHENAALHAKVVELQEELKRLTDKQDAKESEEA